MYRLEWSAGLVLALLSVTSIFEARVSALQRRCRREYQNLPGGIVHTACKGPNPKCKLDGYLTGLNQNHKMEALRAHNAFRTDIANFDVHPYDRAKNMYELEWNDELAEVAQAFAEQCDYSDHDHPEARITSKFKSVGQNYGWAIDTVKQTTIEVKSWIEEWTKESFSYRVEDISSFNTKRATGVVTHFTQVIWAETHYVGCGFSTFQHGQGYARIFVCNYAPAGNVYGKPVYLVGRPCTGCPPRSKCSAKYRVLCDRCRPEYRNLPSGATHTSCKTPNPRCTLYDTLTGLSDQEKHIALQTHNDYRSKIAKGRQKLYGPVLNMYELEWSDELAEVAQAFADQCDYNSHELPEARTTIQFKSVGQNIGWAVDPVQNTATDVKKWIDDWFNELRHYNSHAIYEYDANAGTGVAIHFTQTFPKKRTTGPVTPGGNRGGGGGGGSRVGRRTDYDVDTRDDADDEDANAHLIRWAIVALLASFLLGLCVGGSLAALRTDNQEDGGVVAVNPDMGATDMSYMSTFG
ncbi:hypothetical protein HPB50_015227 [Hyalomma asiaticum]|uniref:Uncharacterized protein n=1 Tax=Hyalomma asiaticum TaxID=266040 RepID=A0ACB7SQG7_HYAAI|nr:hypothetical protein HPB50_015227 [Hyalomma asiaticum]